MLGATFPRRNAIWQPWKQAEFAQVCVSASVLCGSLPSRWEAAAVLCVAFCLPHLSWCQEKPCCTSTLLGWVGWMGFCRANVFVLSFFSKIFCSSAYFLGVWICLVNSMLHIQMKSPPWPGSLASPQCRLLKGQTHTEQVDEPSPSIVHMQSLLLTALSGLLRLPAPATC